MGAEEVRIAKTESLFRDVNERIAESARPSGRTRPRSSASAATRAALSASPPRSSAYDEIRSEGTQFLVAPGHEDARIERVVAKRRRFQVVRKVQRVIANCVRRLDPGAENA